MLKLFLWKRTFIQLKNELYKEVWEILATIWCKSYFPVCKWKIWECQMYWAVVCQLSWSWCFKWILSKTLIWLIYNNLQCAGLIYTLFLKQKCFLKCHKRYVQALLLRGNEILSLTMRKRAIELIKLNSHPCSEPVSLKVILYISYQLKHVGTLKYQYFHKSFEIILKTIPISIMWKLRLKALIMFSTKSWKI